MTGTLAVVKDVEAYLATHATAPGPKVTEWKIEDFKTDLAGTAVRDLANGRNLFVSVGCAQCHKAGALGANYGPELTDVFKRYQNDRGTVLRQILEPSLVISNRYINYEFEIDADESIYGMIVKETPDEITVQTGPTDSAIKMLKKSEIKNRKASALSVMPVGLLNPLTKDQILDLLAFLDAGGKAP